MLISSLTSGLSSADQTSCPVTSPPGKLALNVKSAFAGIITNAPSSMLSTGWVSAPMTSVLSPAISILLKSGATRMAPSSAISRGAMEPSPRTFSAPSSCMGSFRVLTLVRVRDATRISLLSSPSRVRWVTVMSSIWIASARMAMPEKPPPSVSCLWRSFSLVCRITSPRFSHSRSLMIGLGSGAGGRACGSVMSAVTPAMTIVPTSTLPPSKGSSDSPTSNSVIEASMSGSYSV